MALARGSDKIVSFRFFPELDLVTRFLLMAGLVVAGFFVQLMFGLLWGWPLVALGMLLGIVRGVRVQPQTGGPQQWKTTTLEELEDIEKLAKEIYNRLSAADIFRINTWKGCRTLAVAFIGLAVTSAFLWWFVDVPATRAPVMRRLVTPIWVVDFITLMIPVWFAGWIHIWEPPHLSKKVNYLLAIYHAFSSEPELEFVPSLLVEEKDGSMVPHDCRLLVRIRSAPPEFIGIQVQVSMNNVRGTIYPYCYSVIIAKPGFCLKQRIENAYQASEGSSTGGLTLPFSISKARRKSKLPRFRETLVEVKSESEVDVAVMRQSTYFTSIDEATAVFTDALDLAKLLLTNPS